ncbi:MAG TPA: C4-dicarboxylate ABC transporter [Rhodocyclaceae bacterium]|nr:MAG: C4-dicarboxylate ABC transporter [Betaproteobacteria bacterium CG2_30_68_42]PIV72686.1 MAG: C4-dicarboxylate ABC transporter [Rhodocyclales bacterium CG17_big_fil_post_rev_8_21_14_2_50_68_7]PJA58094.1 MAG: C4-dicarboxylate ABC transporter [Rhodocyclales bacterium CG_4_9_14_3_um_filter_68_10]HCX34593.1 C4-dicarboxylate ABC transporter [Rhodocyclaceae bacterium]
MLIAASLLLFGGFALLLVLGAPLAVALGASGALVILVEKLGIMALPTNVYGGIAKYPLLALPVFILAGMVFERAGVALRIVRFTSALVGNRRGAQGIVAILVCMLLGGISGSGPADAAAVAMVMIPGMVKQGYPAAFSAGLIAAAGSSAILIPPSIAFIVYSVLVPQASVPALFAGGLIPGLLAGLALVAPVLYLSMRHGWGAAAGEERVPVWSSLREAIWGLAAPVIILGGLRSGFFTPTEAAVVAVVYGLFVGMVIYRSLDLRSLYRVLVDSAEISAVVMIIIALAAVFAHAGSTLGAFDAFARALIGATSNETLMLVMIAVMILVAGMLLDGISIFLVFLPILIPIANTFRWDPVWFGVVLTMNIAIGQFTPPLAVNLMVTSRIGGVTMESTVPWVLWLVAAMLVALVLVTAFPPLVLWLPAAMGF